MSLTDPQFITWLKSRSRIWCLLIEAVSLSGTTELTRYFSNTGYTSGPSDTPPNTHYLGVITQGGRVREEAPDDGTASMAFTEAELENLDGRLDSLLGDKFTNRLVRMYVGDQRWPRDDFRLIFDGITDGLNPRGREALGLSVRDKLQRLNTAITAHKLGGSSANADRLIPLLFGECHNIEPLFIDKALLKYQVHDGAIERIIEVRDNGVAIANDTIGWSAVTVDLATGTFTLAQQSFGTVTCSAQGDKFGGVYRYQVSTIVQRLATGFGTDPFSSGDLDATQLAAFNVANPQAVGIYLTDVEQVLDVCQRVAASVGGKVFMPSNGLLRIIKIALNLLLEGKNMAAAPWLVGTGLGSFFTATENDQIAPDGTMTATKFVSTVTTSQGLFARQLVALAALTHSQYLCLKVPTQVGVTNFALLCDAGDVESGISATFTTFDEWVLVPLTFTPAAARTFIDFNIRRNGLAPSAAGFTFYAWGAQLLDAVPTPVRPVNMVARGLEIAERPPVSAAVKLGYAKNWTVQTNLQTGVPEEHKDLFKQEWITATASDPDVADDYLLSEDAEQEDTYLLAKADADAEAARRLDMRKSQRNPVHYQGEADLLLEQLGGYQTITHPRFDLAASANGQIDFVERDWLRARPTFEALT